MLTPQFKLTAFILASAIILAVFATLFARQSTIENRVSELEVKESVPTITTTPTASPSATPTTEVTPTKAVKTPTPTESTSEVQ